MELQQIISELQSKNAKAISFDMFDTLVYRPVINPQDLFILMGMKNGYGRNFYYMRINAEKHAAQNRKHGVETVAISDIYESMRVLYGISKEKAQALLKLELEVEYKYILPRRTVVELFNTLQEMGKYVFVTTDMYFPLAFLEKVLKKAGIKGFNKVFVSCEYGKSKRTGNLYEILLEYCGKYNITKKDIVHIGDNRAVDIEMASKKGLKTFYLPSAINRMKSIKGLDKLTRNIDGHLDNSFIIGYIANAIFDNPLKEYNRETIANGELNNMADLTLAPLLFVFFKWMLDDCIQNNINKIFCVYRDGYIAEKIISKLREIYSNNIITEKLYLNRAMMYCFYGELDNALFEGLKDIPVDSNMSVDCFIRNRVLINPDNSDEYEDVLKIFMKYGAKDSASKISGINFDTSMILNELDPYFKKSAQVLIKAMDKYVTSLLDNETNYAIFDIGYRGRVGKFLKTRYNYKFTGYHVCAKSELQMANCMGAQTKALIQRGLDVLRQSELCYVLLDDVVSVQAPGMNKIVFKDDKIDFVYEREQKFSIEIKQIQQRIVQFADNMVSIFGNDLRFLNFDVFPFYDLYITLLSDNISRKDVEMFKEMRSPNDTCLIRLNETTYYQDWYKKIVSKYTKALHEKKAIEENERKKREFDELIKKYQREVMAAENNNEINKSDANAATKTKLRQALYMKLLNSNKKKFLQLYYKTVRNVFEKLSIKEPISQYAYELIFDIKDIIKNQVKQSVELMKDISRDEEVKDGSPVVACFGEIIENKGLGECIKKWDSMKNNYKIVYFRESIEKDLLPCTVCEVPRFLFRNNILNIECKKISVPKYIVNYVKKHQYLSDAFISISCKYNNIPKEYFYLYVYWADKYVKSVMDYLKPVNVIIWLEFYPYHEIIAENCRQRNIKTTFFEFGVLPGTYSFETQGQMGRSYPATEFEKFKEQKVDNVEIDAARKVIEYIRNNNLKRWDDNSDMEIERVFAKVKKNRPIIFYAGQNDFESGMYPYDGKAKKYHSPSFATSDDAASYLAELAKKNDWNLIYKPHPAMVKFVGTPSVPDNVLILNCGDINKIIDKVDLTITILSQVAYMSLLREKPVVLLGYTQLRGKGCVYEAFEKNKIESILYEALNKKYTQEMKEQFNIHVAQVLKYYVYDDGKHNSIPYGKNIQLVANNLCKSVLNNENAVEQVNRFIKRKQKGKQIWENVLQQYSLDPVLYTFIYLPTFDSELNEMALKCIDKAFSKNTRIIIMANDKDILKNGHKYSSCIKRAIYINRYEGQCLLDYYSAFNFKKEFYVIALDRPYARNCIHMIGKKNTSLEELILNGIYGSVLV